MLNLLRLHEGFGLRDFESRTGLPRSVLDAPLAEAVQRGWLDVTDGRAADRAGPPLHQRCGEPVPGRLILA
jgi:coproporphyrinogen III oxidase-like Fe-S oxidoreductase